MGHVTLVSRFVTSWLFRMPLTIHDLIFVASVFGQSSEICVIALWYLYFLTKLRLHFVKVLLENIPIVLHARKNTCAIFLHILMENLRLRSVKISLVFVHAFLHFDFLQIYHTWMHRW